MTSSRDNRAAIRQAFPPPAEDTDWDAVESELGLRLPGSYKALCDLYGDSVIGEPGRLGIELLAPRARDEKNRFPAAALAENASLRRQRDTLGQRFPPPTPLLRELRFFPEEGGLLPWARDAVELIFFEVDPARDPDAWRIVAPGIDGNLVVVDETDVAAFLARLLKVESAA